jgi:PAS domain S-box-containing protein
MEYVMTAMPAGEIRRTAVFVVGRDVTAHRQQLAILRESEEFFRLIFERGPIGILIASADRRILRGNSRFAEILGYDEAELAALRIDDLTHPEDFDRERPLFDRLGEGTIEDYWIEKRLVRKDGRFVWTQVTRTAVRDDDRHIRYLVSFTEDIDERKRTEAERGAMEERLRERQKLESLGLLAGGIAHDLNNLLVPILGNAELVLTELPQSAQRDALQEIVLASRRAAQLAQQMLAYSGRGHFVMSPVDLSSVVRDLGPVLRASAPASVTVRLDLAPRLPEIQADAGQMRQLLLNLAQNAHEAMHDDGGALVVSTGIRPLTDEVLESFYLPTDLPEGEYVFLRVRDTGKGIRQDARAGLFNPFFSTKGPGRGLGLPAVLGIVRGHGGAIQVDSTPGQGTAVTVYFPVLQVQSRDTPRAPVEDTLVERGQGRVLVVEDDEAVCALAARTLERAGYQVITASDGAAAVSLFRARATDISCVVLDLVLPRLHGENVCRELKALAPEVPIIAMSGYPDAAMSDWVAAAVAGVLQKPFTPQTLRDAVHSALIVSR